jgi:ABC-type sulfate transport system permease component
VNAEPDTYEWPDDAAPEPPQPGVIMLLVLYLAPFLLLLLFPTIAWIALLPLTPLVNRTTHPAHRRRAVAAYLVTGLISLAPWVAILFD